MVINESAKYLGKKLNQICYIKIVCKYLIIKTKEIIYFANFEASAKFWITFWGCNHYRKYFFDSEKSGQGMFKLNYN